MKNRVVLAGMFCAFLSVLLFNGCSSPGAPSDSKAVLQEGLFNLMGVTSYKYTFGLKGDVVDNSVESESQNMNFDIKLEGALDVKDLKEPKMIMNIDGTAETKGAEPGTGTLTAEIKLDKVAVYGKLLALKLSGTEMPAEFANQMNKWWKITLPPGTIDEFAATLPQGSEDQMTPQQKEIKELIKNTQFFKDPVYEGAEDVMGEKSYKFSTQLDEEALIDFMMKVSQIQGETVSLEQVEDLRKGFETADVSGFAWVGIKSKVLNKADVNVVMKGDSPGTVNIGFSLGDINKDVSLNVPADAEEFPLAALFGSMMAPPGAFDPGNVEGGVQGLEGLEGLEGMEGLEGLEGMEGLEGLEGMEGLEGLEGMEGLEGLEGVEGLEGLEGLEGVNLPASS